MNRIRALGEASPERSLPPLPREDEDEAARGPPRARTRALAGHRTWGAVILGFPASVGGTGLPQSTGTTV